MKKLLGILAIVYLGGGFGWAIYWAGDKDPVVRAWATGIFILLIAGGIVWWHIYDRYSRLPGPKIRGSGDQSRESVLESPAVKERRRH